MKIVGIIAAGGSGSRLGRAGGKQLLAVAGRPLAAWAAEALARARMIDELVIVCDPASVKQYAHDIGATLTTDKPVAFVPGGATRADSVVSGLLATDAEVVAIHDGARPLLEPMDADRAVQAFVDNPDVDGVVLGHPAIDTIKIVDTEVVATPSRDDYWLAQTPQVFRRTQLLDAYAQAAAAGLVGTDDSSYIEQGGGRVIMVEGQRANIKVTIPSDLAAIDASLQTRRIIWKAL
ncbi:MAG: 2-C-methyl-D-erythritol 4-phosphate cytidylyltransferase [Actinomycetes bacterium]|jgi:2-C-methyl-D-erythritol 4-phosphate cytidylyltransferase|nr:2-C-methyl-D-erythritol 4-phosphate cytidylyltransferase [Actinomycetes bacterium]